MAAALQRYGSALLLAWTALALRAQPVLACAVCFDQNEQRRAAFFGTTVFLSVLPLVLIGSLAWWLRQRMRAADPGDGDSGEG